MSPWCIRSTLAAYLMGLIAALPALVPISLPAQPAVASSAHAAAVPRIIDTVWAGTGIAYDAVSVGPIVYITYYDAQRRITVARVDTEAGTVAKKTLDSPFEGWDAHNYVTLAYDRAGFLHVSGNMHTSPLVYARTLQPDDFNSLTQLNRMVGIDESSVTYPRFFTFSNGDLGFTYRSGRSGNGVELINRFDGERWKRLLAQPLFGPESGSESVNAYHTGYLADPDGQFHVAWVWRKTRMAETNFNVSYARSQDLQQWTDSDGRALTLPITPATAEVVDPIPPGGGLLNNIKLGFDANGAPVISYLKYDRNGYSQLYHARAKKGGWQIAKATDWQYRWAFSGPGTLVGEISFTGVRIEQGRLLEDVSHKHYGRLRLELDLVTLAAHARPAPVANPPAAGDGTKALAPYRLSVRRIRPETPGSVQGVIQWETLGSDNNDRPRACASVDLPQKCRMTSKLKLLVR